MCLIFKTVLFLQLIKKNFRILYRSQANFWPTVSPRRPASRKSESIFLWWKTNAPAFKTLTGRFWTAPRSRSMPTRSRSREFSKRLARAVQSTTRPPAARPTSRASPTTPCSTVEALSWRGEHLRQTFSEIFDTIEYVDYLNQWNRLLLSVEIALAS